MTPFRVRGKNVLVFGLGLLGGGLATTQWLLREGAFVRVTDSKDEKALAPSLKTLGRHPHLSFTLGRHSEEDIAWADLIIVNPGVPKESPYLTLARRLKKPLWNDAALFFTYIKRPIIGITGTRGKTTVTAWTARLISKKGMKAVPTGNTPTNPFLSEITRAVHTNVPVVAELSSWQLELLPASNRAPHIAIITNLYPDHLNRYRDMEEYADAKANIYKHQSKRDALIVNADHPWTPYFLRKRPKSRIYFASSRPLQKGKSGICVINGQALFVFGKRTRALFSVERFRKERGEHNLMNLLQATLAAILSSPDVRISEKDILRLPAPRFRQEVIIKNKRLIVVNDTTATSPDGTVAALRRFSRQGSVILIVGGTDKRLDFTDLAKELQKTISPEHIIFLEGSATKRLRAELKGWDSECVEERSLAACVRRALRIAKHVPGQRIILFSPGAASFEKFKNEFDRGEQFEHIMAQALNR